VLVRDVGGVREVLLQHRSGHVHEGGTWAMPGGARDSHEDVVTAALREAAEEVAVDPADVAVLACVRGLDHVDWSYTYVIGSTGTTTVARRATFETVDLAWVPVTGTPPDGRPLHGSLAADWTRLSAVAAAVAWPV
jgi:8-oxo-dGTP diphosphatase